MSCISSNFSSFFLNSLNDPSEFSKYLSNGELRFSSTFEDFQVYGQAQQLQQQQQQQQHQHHINGGELINGNGDESNSNIENTQPIVTSVQHYGNYQPPPQHQMHPNHVSHPHIQQQQTRWVLPQHQQPPNSSSAACPAPVVSATGAQHFDGSFEFMKYLRHSNDYNDTHSHEGTTQNQTQSNHTTTAVGTKPDGVLNNSFMDLDNAHKRAAARKTPVLSSVNGNNGNASNTNSQHPTPMAIDIYDHDSKHNIYDLHHMSSVHSSNSNESSMELSSMTYPNSHLNASNSNTSSEGCGGGGNNPNHNDFSMLSGVANSQASTASNTATAAAAASPAAPKPLASFTIKDNFEAHPSHKVEEGIFQHMNKLPSKKKENLKQLGVRFTGQMTLNDKSIIVENFIRFCQEYDIKDHRPFLSLNQSGLNKPDQIKFARYLGQGLPTFTLFCIYSNFKNLFCTKRTEIYTKDGYNLPYILDKIKRFLANTSAGNNNNNASNSSSTSTTPTIAASSSNTNSTNSNITPNNTTTSTTISATTTIVNTNISNNNATSVPVAMQNGNSESNGDGANNGSNSNSSINSIITGIDNDRGKGNSSNCINNNNEIINTPTKQIHNVPSPVTPRTPQTQQQQQQLQQQQQHQPMQIQQTPTQNTPLPAHPPPTTTHTIIATHHSSTPQNHIQQQQQQHHNNNHHHQQQQQIHHHHHPNMQIPMSSMVVVTTAAPSALMGSPMAPTVAPTSTIITQATTNHNQHPFQHTHHMQPNNHHLSIQHHPHHIHPVNQPPMQQHPHHTTAANNATVAVVAAATNTFAYQQHQHQHQLQQNHHPLHNLAAQNPPL